MGTGFFSPCEVVVAYGHAAVCNHHHVSQNRSRRRKSRSDKGKRIIGGGARLGYLLAQVNLLGGAPAAVASRRAEIRCHRYEAEPWRGWLWPRKSERKVEGDAERVPQKDDLISNRWKERLGNNTVAPGDLDENKGISSGW